MSQTLLNDTKTDKMKGEDRFRKEGELLMGTERRCGGDLSRRRAF